jgi:4-amino-4-deoxy-L-arabinose transferase-like glycosyltransferase
LNENRTTEAPFSRWTAPLSAVAIATCLFGNLGALGLTGPDEPRYAWIARAMAETGDWITPRLYGQPWFEKPVLYYWTAAVGFSLNLTAEWAARLPSALAALGATLLIAWLAKVHYGGEMRSLSSPVLLAPVLFATSVAGIGFARAATPDMLFSASFAAAMASAATVVRHAGVLRTATAVGHAEPRGDCLPLALFGASLGLAVLAKGPAAVILAAGAIAIWAAATRSWRVAFGLAHPIAIAAFCIVAIPWYALCAARNPDFLRVFIWQHNFERYATPVFQHRQPFWYFAPIILLALLPWTVLLWPVTREGLRLWRGKTWKNSPGFFLACWAVWPVVFFSFSQSKLPGYILPSIPALALLCAVAVSRTLNRSQRQARSICVAVGITWVVIAAAASVAWPRDSVFVPTIGRLVVSPGLFVAAGMGVVAAVLLVASFRGEPTTVLLLGALLVAASVEIASWRLLPALDSELSARPHAEFMHNDQHADRIFTYQLPRSRIYGLNFYFHREVPEWSPADALPALVLTTPAGLEQIEKLGRVNGDIEQTQPGLVYVPIAPLAMAR